MATGFINGAVSVDDAPTSRTNLGLGTMSTQNIAAITASMVPNGDRAESLGSASNSWDNLYADGVTFDDGSNVLSSYVASSTFTPALAFGGGTTGITYTTQTGRYFKVGNLVFFTILLALSNKGSSTGAATITALPYTVNMSSGAALLIHSNLTVPTGRTDVYFGPTNTQTYGELFGYGTATTSVAVTDAEFANNTNIRITGVYLTNS